MDQIERVVELYRTNGNRLYDLHGVTQLEHALQSAAHAEAQGLSREMIAACLLHDVGHLFDTEEESPIFQGRDDWHEVRGSRFLQSIFGPALSDPIRLHVAAKRYLVTVEPGYFEKLAEDSRRSLIVQGGKMDDSEIAAFEAEPAAKNAVQLRRIDEISKCEGAATKSFDDYVPLLRNLIAI